MYVVYANRSARTRRRCFLLRQNATIKSGGGGDDKKVSFAGCFLFSKLTLTLVAFSSLISAYRASAAMTAAMAMAASNPRIYVAGQRRESEKKEGAEIVHSDKTGSSASE